MIHRDPFSAGYIASRNGIPRWANPHRDNSTARENWDAGWLADRRSPSGSTGRVHPPTGMVIDTHG